MNAETPAAFNFPKSPVASPTAVFTPVIDFDRLGNSPIICFNASFAPKVAPRIVLIPPKLFIADLVIFQLSGILNVVVRILSLILCPECNKKISDKANSCPNCGYPMNDEKETRDITYSIVLNNYGVNRLETIKCVRRITGLDLKPAMNIVDNSPIVIICDISLDKAESIKREFDYIGSETTIKKYDISDKEKSEPKCNVLHCPHCGSTSVTTGQRGFSLFSGFLGSNKTVNRCGSCGWTWEPRR